MKAITFFALLTLSSVVSAGPLVLNTTVDITLDGYCDGMHLVINQSTGTVSGNSTGCETGPLTGHVGSNSKSGAGVVVLVNGLGGPVLFRVDDNPRKWSLRNTDGSIVNSGTYSIGVPALAPEAAQATQSSTD
jgi:hypothetical protein